jgi:hypothetical protein
MQGKSGRGVGRATHTGAVCSSFLAGAAFVEIVPLALSRIEHHGKLVKKKSDRLLLIVIGFLFDLSVVSSSVSSSSLRHRVEDCTYFRFYEGTRVRERIPCDIHR